MIRMGVSALALLVAAGQAQAEVTLDWSGSIKTTVKQVDSNVTEYTNITPLIVGVPIPPAGVPLAIGLVGFGNGLALIGGTPLAASVYTIVDPATTTSAETTVDLDVDLRGVSAGVISSYGADLDIDLNADGTLSTERARIFAITKFGGFSAGLNPAGNKSADRIAAGESGVSTEPLGREYAAQLANSPDLSYGISLMGVTASVAVTDFQRFEDYTYNFEYKGETLSDAKYEVFFRGYHTLNPEIDGNLIANRAEGQQIGTLVSYGNFELAGSAGKDQGTNYALLNGNQNPLYLGIINAIDSELDDIDRSWWNIGGAYKHGALKVSADYDQGKVLAPWDRINGLGTPTVSPLVTSASALLNLPLLAGIGGGLGQGRTYQDYNAWSVGAEYELAPGLILGAGYKRYNGVIALDLDTDVTSDDYSGLLNGGLKMVDQSEMAASITLNF